MRKLQSNARTLAISLTVVLGLGAASCTHPDESRSGTNGGMVRAEGAGAGAVSLHPSIAADAADGYVHEFY